MAFSSSLALSVVNLYDDENGEGPDATQTNGIVFVGTKVKQDRDVTVSKKVPLEAPSRNTNKVKLPSKQKVSPKKKPSVEDLKAVRNEKISFREGQRGSRLLEVCGYTYVRNRSLDNKTYWICARKVR